MMHAKAIVCMGNDKAPRLIDCIWPSLQESRQATAGTSSKTHQDT